MTLELRIGDVVTWSTWAGERSGEVVCLHVDEERRKSVLARQSEGRFTLVRHNQITSINEIYVDTLVV